MEEFSKPPTPVAEIRSWRDSICSCSDHDLLDGTQLQKLVVCAYKACVNNHSCPIYIDSGDPIDNIFIAAQKDISEGIQCKQKIPNDKNNKIDANAENVHEIKTNLSKNNKIKIKAGMKDEYLQQHFSASVTRDDNATELSSNQHLKDEKSIRNMHPDIEFQDNWYLEDDAITVLHNHHASDIIEKNDLDGSFEEKYIYNRSNNKSNSRSSTSSNNSNKIKEMSKNESKPTNMYEKDTLAGMCSNEFLGREKTGILSYMDPNNQDLYLDKNRHKEKLHCNHVSFNQTNQISSNTCNRGAKTNANKLEACKQFCSVYRPCPICRKVFIEEQNEVCHECCDHKTLKEGRICTACKTNDASERKNIYPDAEQDWTINLKNKNPESREDNITYRNTSKVKNNYQKHSNDNSSLLIPQTNIDLTNYIKACIHEEFLKMQRLSATSSCSKINGSSRTIQKSTQYDILARCYNKPLKPAYQENPYMYIRKYHGFSCEEQSDVPDKYSRQNDKNNNIRNETHDKHHNNRRKHYYDPPRTKKGSFSRKNNRNNTVKGSIMHTNICKIDPVITNGQIDKYYQTSAFVTNKTTTSKPYKASVDELASQIMNVPYELFKKVVYSGSKPVHLTEFFQKLQDMYAACSCKVCECIKSNPRVASTEICNCLPCDCAQCRAKDVYFFSECNNWMTNNKKYPPMIDCLSSETDFQKNPCKCTPCECTECKPKCLRVEGLNKKNNFIVASVVDNQERPYCTCSLSSETDFQKNPCKCTPCECTECKPKCLRVEGLNKKNNFIVASVVDNQERPYCTCSPCGCFECAHPYGTRVPTHYQDAETETDNRRHMNCNCNNCINDNCEQEGTDTCTCDKYSKLMSKPVTNDKKDFDIHYVVHKPTNLHAVDSVPIYTSLLHQIFYPRKTKPIVDDCSNGATNIKYSSKLRSRIVNTYPQDYWALRANIPLISNCNCRPCKCIKCEEHFLKGHIPYRSNSHCEVCECINYASLKYNKYNKNLNNPVTYQPCDCRPCNCEHCMSYKITFDHERLNDITFHDDNTQPKKNTPLVATDSVRDTDQISSEIKIKYSENLNNTVTHLQCNSRPCKCDHCMSYKVTIDQDRLNTLRKEDTVIRTTNSIRLIDQIVSKETKTRKPVTDDCDISRTLTCSDDSEVIKLDCKNLQNNKRHVFEMRHLDKNPSFNNDNVIKYGTNKVVHNTFMYDDNKYRKNKIKQEFKTSIRGSDENTIRPNSTVVSGASLGTTHYISKLSKLPMKQESSTKSFVSLDNEYSLPYPLLESSSTVKACINDVMNLRLYNMANNFKSNYEPTGNIMNKNFSFLNVIDNNGFVQIDNIDKTTLDQSCQSKLCSCSDSLNKLNVCQFKSTICGPDNIYFKQNMVLIRQNEFTQTAICMLCAEENKKVSPLMKEWNVSFSDNNRIIRCPDVPTQNYQTSNMIRTRYTSVNYDSIQRIIKESKQYSLQLLNILHKYKEANKDFDRIRTKFKMQHELLLDRVKEQRKTDESTSTVLNSNDHSLLDIENNKIINSIKLEFRKLKNLHKSNQIINSRHIITKNLQSHESNTTRVTNTTDESITRKTDEGNCVQEVNKEENKENSKDKAKLENTDQQQEENNGNKTNIPVKITELPMPLSKIKEKAHLEKLKVAFMEDSQHLDKMLYKCMKNTWREKETIPSITRKPAVPELDIHELSLKEPLRYENSFDKDSSALNTVFICNSHKDRVNNKKLGKETQAELKPLAVAIQRDTHDTTKNHKASQNIMNQVSHDGQSQIRSAPSMGSKKFLDWVARSNGNTSITSNLKRDSTHNPLKVVFTTARILTDHSLLLRWKIPEDITTVEGYEILINGRSVLKITSPSKNIAVLSCLPHAKQLRLTVRTLIIPSVDSSKAAFSTASATVVIPTYKKSLLYLEKLH